jgi:hypothetical protein
MRIIPHALKYILANANDEGMLVKVRCDPCAITHRYRAGDLLAVCGDVALREIAGNFRREKCQRKAFTSANWLTVQGPDIKTVRIGRLVRVRMVRVFDWEDRTL